MTYAQELQKLFERFKSESGVTVVDFEPGELNADGTLSPAGLRAIHEELCRQSNLPAVEIIADWNRRSPEDPW